MPISSGTKLGGFEIVGPIGAGGMGEVYRARDRKLGREVAIKVLPAALVRDQERIDRFEQEAKATSALNHPNILTVYEVDQTDGAPFIVMELLDGEDLRGRLKGPRLPWRAAVGYARQIVSGLAAAHDRGIVHRDLKPENLFVTTDDRIKILDFGLAKLTAPTSIGSVEDAATRRVLTEPGVVMGTVGYMSPEQARGQATDHRSDLFSFGAILYEMLAGRRAFQHDTTTDTLAAILREDPAELSTIAPEVPPGLERIVRRCLEKRPERRFQSTTDLGFALDALAESATASGPRLAPTPTASGSAAAASRLGGQVAWLLAGACGLVALGALGVTYLERAWSTSRSAGAAIRLTFAPPANLAFNDTRRDDAVVSPDGTKIAFTANAAGNDDSLIYVRALDSGETSALPGTGQAIELFWSPDSRAIGFGSQGKLKRVDLAGGTPQVLCDAARLTGGTWNREQVVVFGPDYGSPLFEVPATGGERKPVTSLDLARGDREHDHPSFLPDGRHFLFSRSVVEVAGSAALSGVWVGSLDAPTVSRVLPDSTNALYVTPGWLVFVRNQVLVAQAFDAAQFSLSGEAMPIVSGASTAAGYRGFSASDTGVLVSLAAWQREYQLIWFDREGRQTGVLGNPTLVSADEEPTIAPDGRHVAFKEDGNIWVSDLSGANAIRLGPGQLEAWSPDSRKLVYASVVAGHGRGIVERAANGVGDPELLLSGTVFPKAWSPDGKFLVYLERGATTRGDLWTLPPQGAGHEHPLLQSAADEQAPAFAPDGRWLAFDSDETGRYEVYVQSFLPDGTVGSDRRRISANGGVIPNWRHDQQELFYVGADGQMMAVSVKRNGSDLDFEPPRALFKTRMLSPWYGAVFHQFDVTGDGQRFLIGTMIGDPKSPLPTVVVNWMAGLKK